MAAPAFAQQDDELDTEHLFGVTEGSDIGNKGERELELEVAPRIGKGQGTYFASSQSATAKYMILDHFRIAPGIAADYHHIRGVPGLDDRNQLALAGLFVETRYRIVDRHKAPFGLTVGFTPYWWRADTKSGEPIDQYGGEFLLAVDKPLIPKRLFGGLNLTYQPQATRSRTTGAWNRDSMLGISAGVSTQATRRLSVGGEVRYARHYADVALNRWDGHALFVGPAAFYRLSETSWISASWNIQVAGHLVGQPSALDLVNFERHQVSVRYGTGF